MDIRLKPMSSKVGNYLFVIPAGPVRKIIHEKPVADFRPSREDEIEIIDQYCSYFGCGRILSLSETLCGDRCIRHQRVAEDIMNAISF